MKCGVIIDHSGTWDPGDLGSDSGMAIFPLSQLIKAQYIYSKKNGGVDHHCPIQLYLGDTVGLIPDHSNQECLTIKRVIIFLLVEVLPSTCKKCSICEMQ